MPILKGLEWTFDTVASTYEKLRPGYVEELYQKLFDYISISENSNVVEIGSGGGQATAPILKTGCRLTAVEYGEQFSELLKDKVLVKKSVGNFLNQQQLPITDIFYAVPIAFLSDCAQG